MMIFFCTSGWLTPDLTDTLSTGVQEKKRKLAEAKRLNELVKNGDSEEGGVLMEGLGDELDNSHEEL